jgi:hypothetical protein
VRRALSGMDRRIGQFVHILHPGVEEC